MKSPQRLPTVIALLTLVFLAQPGLADKETDWLELREGAQDKATRATVLGVKESDNGDGTQVTIAIPKSTMKTTDEIEEIVVLGRAPKEQDKPVKLNVRYEWVSDYDNDNYGLIITLGKNTKLPIRLYLKGDTK